MRILEKKKASLSNWIAHGGTSKNFINECAFHLYILKDNHGLTQDLRLRNRCQHMKELSM